MLEPAVLQTTVLAALSMKYNLKGVVVVNRASCARALDEAEGVAKERYGSRFNRSDYAVHEASGRWRLRGAVFAEPAWNPPESVEARLLELEADRVRVLTARAGVIGVLKYDQGKRIPWGHPAEVIARFLAKTGGREAMGLLSTGRSARTVRGVLRLFDGLSASRTSRSP